MYKEISEYNVDIVWIKCVDIWNRHVEPVVPENDLDTWYSKVQYILHCFFSFHLFILL